MKRLIAIMLSLAIAMCPVAMIGCSTAHDSVRYTHSQNDGHLHEYVHELHPDRYVCHLCGKVYEGDPANLREF